MSDGTFAGAHILVIVGLILVFIGLWFIVTRFHSSGWGWFWLVLGAILLFVGFGEVGRHGGKQAEGEKEGEKPNPDPNAAVTVTTTQQSAPVPV